MHINSWPIRQGETQKLFVYWSNDHIQFREMNVLRVVILWSRKRGIIGTFWKTVIVTQIGRNRAWPRAGIQSRRKRHTGLWGMNSKHPGNDWMLEWARVIAFQYGRPWWCGQGSQERKVREKGDELSFAFDCSFVLEITCGCLWCARNFAGLGNTLINKMSSYLLKHLDQITKIQYWV